MPETKAKPKKALRDRFAVRSLEKFADLDSAKRWRLLRSRSGRKGAAAAKHSPSRWKAGGGPPRRVQPATKACPEHIIALGLEEVWRHLRKASQAGNPTAAKQLIELAEKYATREDPRGDARYQQVLPDVASSLVRLDTGLGDILDRHEHGLPLSAEEQRLLETAKRFKTPASQAS